MCLLLCIWGFGTDLADNLTAQLSHSSTSSSQFTVTIGQNFLSSFFTFTFRSKIFQNSISSHLTVCFCHASQVLMLEHTVVVLVWVLLQKLTATSEKLNRSPRWQGRTRTSSSLLSMWIQTLFRWLSTPFVSYMYLINGNLPPIKKSNKIYLENTYHKFISSSLLLE